MIDLPKFATPLVLSALLTVAAGAATPQDGERDQQAMTRVQLAQVTIEQRVIIRIPLVRPGAAQGQRAALAPPMPDPPPATIKEVKGPKCLKLDRLRGAVINAVTGVTMLTDKDERFRTHFGRTCRPADFYSGFYIEPNKDGSICAGRDTLRARNGSSCDIEKFGKLVEDDDD
ncbi:MAG: hypothetical protein J7494_04495 [Sphingobium sp.]|nr:hypothetical protein [Sphingobium sp.]